ncbi:hypothetical protein TorRG33x02_304890 [Trema orientale]|uniref:C-JID domain-containing protein n=1 Tax=Trema orientale TaxID=63057 RepID=A0A2P5BXT8_TREOI|nr:hypothetical protein TorRG33x02_304890 [Trema orientale]
MVNAEITIPGSKIPDWFNHHDTKGKISFEVPSSLYAKPLVWSFYVVFGVAEEGAHNGTVGSCVANKLFPGFFEMALEEDALDSV